MKYLIDKIFMELLLIIFLPIAHSVLVKFDDCGNGEFISIDIAPCKYLPCHFEKGERANATFVFKLKQSANYLRIASTLRTGGWFNYELEVYDEDPEVCNGWGKKDAKGKLQCPIKADNTYSFMISRQFPISTSYNIFRYSRIKLLNEKGKMVACADWHLSDFNRNEVI